MFTYPKTIHPLGQHRNQNQCWSPHAALPITLRLILSSNTDMHQKGDGLEQVLLDNFFPRKRCERRTATPSVKRWKWHRTCLCARKCVFCMLSFASLRGTSGILEEKSGEEKSDHAHTGFPIPRKRYFLCLPARCDPESPCELNHKISQSRKHKGDVMVKSGTPGLGRHRFKGPISHKALYLLESPAAP